jgi:argininosuccinate synthase
VLHTRDSMQAKYAELVYNGFWFTAERESMQVYFDHVAKSTTGIARMKMFKGQSLVVGRKSPISLYDPTLVTFEKETVYDQADAGGFIKLNALRARVRARLQKD